MRSNCWWKTWKWIRKLFFHFLNHSILNSIILLNSRGSKLSHKNFRLSLVRELTQQQGRVPRILATKGGKQAPSTSQMTQPDTQHNEQWPLEDECVQNHVTNKGKDYMVYPTTSHQYTEKSRSQKCNNTVI
jgi:hypothetical protein